MTDEKKYRTEVPNIIDDLGLDPYERTLYVHYKRVCGANGGQCTEGVRAIASRTKMSVGKITKARKTLFNRGLIAGDVQHGKDSAVTVVDIWDINTAYYADKNRPNVDGWGVAELRQWVNHCSPGEQLDGDISLQNEQLPADSSPPEQNCSYSEQNCSPGEQKKEPLKNQIINSKRENLIDSPPHEKNQPQAAPPPISESQKRVEEPEDSPVDPTGIEALIISLAALCKFNRRTITSKREEMLKEAAKKLHKKGVGPPGVEAFGVWWKYNDYRGNSPPYPDQILDEWGKFEAGESNKRTNGARNNGHSKQNQPKSKRPTAEPGPIDKDTWDQMLKSVA